MNLPRKWSLVLVPDHLGVIHVRGRVGACRGPEAFERIFVRLPHDRPEERVVVSGLDGDIEHHHRQASDAILGAHRKTGFSVVIGGGHDHGFSHLKGLVGATGPRWGCINIDAHLDVRKPEPVATSGSPFYLAIESGVLDPAHLVEFGIQSHCNSKDLWSYAESKALRVVPFAELRRADVVSRFSEELERLAGRVDAVAISLDLDALSQDHCPGVSAPQAEGLSSRELMGIMEVAGSHPKVRSLGVFELNPEHDVQDGTARVAATAVHHFLYPPAAAGRASGNS